MRLAFITPDLSDNSLGRTYCLWLLCRQLGWNARVYSVRGESVWTPLRDSVFASICTTGTFENILNNIERFDPEVIISVKAHPWSLGIAHEIAKARRLPLILDYDDPDLEAVLSWRRPVRRVALAVTQRDRVRSYKEMMQYAQRLPKTVSNPTLQSRWGGTIIPHVREKNSEPPYAADGSKDPGRRILFMGTNRHHKGLPVLRRALRQASQRGWTLTVTAEPPADAKTWERWIGATPISEVPALLEQASVVVIPSLNTTFSRGQLPAKLIDALMAGKALIVSDLPPIRWAADSAALYCRPGSARSIDRALAQFEETQTLAMYSRRARSRALTLFTVESNMARFEHAIQAAILETR